MSKKNFDDEIRVLANHFNKYKTEEAYVTLLKNTAEFRKTLNDEQSEKFNELFFNAVDFFLFAENKSCKDGFDECMKRIKAIQQRQK